MTAAEHVVIGGAGFIGSAVCRQLAQDHEVMVLDDLSTGHRANVDVEGVRLRVGSILDEDALREVLRDARVVYHLACLGVRHSIHAPRANHEVNAEGTLRVLEAARSLGVERVVYTSTSEVYGSALSTPITESHPTFPHTVYGAAKLAGEAYARAYHRTYDLATVVIRPFNAYGPRSHHEGDSGEVIPRFLVRAMNGLAPVIFGNGTQARDFTYVEDTARAIIAAGAAPDVEGTTINVANGRSISITELADVVLRATGRGDLVPSYVDERPGDVHTLLGSNDRARELLGWRPEVSLHEGVAQLLAWHKAEGTEWDRALAEMVERNWVAEVER